MICFLHILLKIYKYHIKNIQKTLFPIVIISKSTESQENCPYSLSRSTESQENCPYSLSRSMESYENCPYSLITLTENKVKRKKFDVYQCISLWFSVSSLYFLCVIKTVSQRTHREPQRTTEYFILSQFTIIPSNSSMIRFP